MAAVNGSRGDLARVLPITGYLDRLSVRPGGALEVKVSAQGGGDYAADVVRVVSGDPNPAGPGLILEPQDFGAGTHAARSQPVDLGSYAVIPPHAALRRPALWISMMIQPWLLRESPSTLAAATDLRGRGWALEVTASDLRLRVLSEDGTVAEARLAHAARLKTWLRVWAGVDGVSGRLEIGCAPLGAGEIRRTSAEAPPSRFEEAPTLTFAARLEGGLSRDHFNGRIERPRLHLAPPDEDGAWAPGALFADWDFSQGIETSSLMDRGPHGLSGRLVNLPTRAVRGAAWDGSAMDWRAKPEHYGAIHFHEDDLSDCRWETDFRLRIPDETPSGGYGLRLRKDGAEDVLPFYVLPAEGAPKPPFCVLASTLTHLAYANHARGNVDAAFRARMAAWGAPPNADEFPIYGRSTYNLHPDGGGISLSSRLRPVLTMRPGYLTFDDPRGSGLRHYPADTHLTCWLDRMGFAYDVVTDEDLDDHGAALLEGYRAVLTGSHPEYHTPCMLDALQAYRDAGGRLVYLGGNGFYWRIARRPEQPGVIEVRRAEGGIRAWAADPGEAHHQLDGGYGGLWRRNGRPPQALTGVGFSAQGLFEGGWYRRTEASYAPEHAWIFEGVEEERLGDYGLSAGGAAGFELDRADPSLGTPEGAVVLAVSEGLGESFVTVPEELLSHLRTVNDEPPEDLIRGEIVHARLPGGGELFSVGSITFCGSLLANGGDNGISRMISNVLARFGSEGA